MERWELEAREQVRQTMARYNWSGDSLRLDGIAASFCEDGVLEVRGRQPVVGRDAIVAFMGGVATDADGRVETDVRRVVRHNVTNTHFTSVTPTEAHVDSYFTVLTEIGLDHYGRYRDVFVPVGDEWLIRHRKVVTDWHDPRSAMVTPADVP